MKETEKLHKLIRANEDYLHDFPVQPLVSFDGKTIFTIVVYPTISDKTTICLSVRGERESARAIEIDAYGGVSPDKSIKQSATEDAKSLFSMPDNIIAEVSAGILLGAVQMHEAEEEAKRKK